VTAAGVKPVLSAVGLTKLFPLRQGLGARTTMTAVDDVSFDIHAGRTLALVGESGSGKSTVGKLMLDLLAPDDGEVSFEGQSLRSLPRSRRRDFRRSVQIVFQNPFRSFSPMLTIGGSIRDALRLRRLPRDQQDDEVAQLLADVQLARELSGRYPNEVSGGQLQRVGIARAIATNPQVIFIDEPTSALDVSLRGQIVNLLLDLQNERELAYVLVSHDLRLVATMAQEIVVMYLGHVMEHGPAELILERPTHPYTLALLAAAHAKSTGVRTDDVTALRGEVVALPSTFRGCKLIHRCPFAQPACSEPQVLRQFEGRLVRCRRAEEIREIARPAPEAVTTERSSSVP
jgi:oligopeptide/dipeptide ABC transporter ATP-binding protein